MELEWAIRGTRPSHWLRRAGAASLWGQAAKAKLTRLILGEKVDLRTAYRVDQGRLVCDVYLGGKNLADYFPEYT